MRGGDALARLIVGLVANPAISARTFALEAVGLGAALGGAGDRVGELGVGVGEELLRLGDRVLVGGEQLLLGLVALGGELGLEVEARLLDLAALPVDLVRRLLAQRGELVVEVDAGLLGLGVEVGARLLLLECRGRRASGRGRPRAWRGCARVRAAA